MHSFKATLTRFLGLTCGMVLSSAALSSMQQPVMTATGLVEGVAIDGLRVFKGIPYAAPPTGDLRWRPPVAAARWDGVRQADHFAPDCPASRPVMDSTVETQSEDCLYLNIWTPAKKANAKLPVMVWIYGSGFQSGTSSAKRFDGAGLASKGVVLVSMNFRGGILGYMTHPLLSAESPQHVSGNYGVLDGLAALQWVQRNIAAFGGDPKRITIFGQSSGSETVNILTATPLAKGLFQRAIGESGGSFGQRQPRTLAQSEQDGVAYAAKLGASTLAELRAKTTEELFKAGPPRLEPVIDGWLLPTDAHDIYAAGRQNDVPMLVGSNADESQLSNSLTATVFQTQVRERYGARADDFFKLFPASSDDEARASSKASGTILLGDYNTATWARSQAKTGKSRVFQYRYTHAHPPALDASAPARNGAFHGAEIIYAFNNLSRENRAWTEVDQALAKTMSSYWVNFARSGNPNGPGLPRWPSVQENKTQVMEFGGMEQLRVQLIPRPNTTQIDFFEDVFYKPGGLYR